MNVFPRWSRRSGTLVVGLLLVTLLAGCGSPFGDDDKGTTTIRLGVHMTAPELESFQKGIDQVSKDHPEWKIVIEQTPQASFDEKFNSQIASNTLPDVVQLAPQNVQQGIQQGVLLDLTDLIGKENFKTDDFWEGAITAYTNADGHLFGVPFSASPDIVFYNKAMFTKAGLPFPTDDWTYDDLKTMAIKLTLDKNGKSADDPDFDPSNVVQWGLNVSPAHLFSRHYLIPLGGDPCKNPLCTEMSFSDPAVMTATSWWVDLVSNWHAAPYDPYSGNQTGVPGDPFLAGLAAIGFDGYFAVGQLNAAGTIDYDIVQPPAGPTGERAGTLSLSGFGIATNSKVQTEAFKLLQILTSADFTATYWAKPGNGVPAAKSGADSILNPGTPPTNQQAIIASMDYAETFKPYTEGAFDAYGQTVDIFIAVMKGETSVADGAAQIDKIVADTVVHDPAGP